MPWYIVVWFCCVGAGYGFLWIAFINRTHAWRLRSRALKRIRHASYLLVPFVPLCLFYLLGAPVHFQSQQLVLTTEPAWGAISILCCGGLLWAIWCSVRRHLVDVPQGLCRTNSQVFDIAAEMGRIPLAHGDKFLLGKFPGNSQFKLEYTTREFFLPRLPPAWDGLTLLHLTDFHFHGVIEKEYFVRALQKVGKEKFDLVCFTGDLLDRMEMQSWLPETLGQLDAGLGKYFILGNHDWYLDPEQIRSAMRRLGWRDLAGKSETITYRGARLAIGGDETPWMGEHPQLPADADFRLLLGHTPDNLPWARTENIDLMLSGHNHGGQVKIPGIGPVFSPSRYGVKYSDGVFWEAPTLLHVSRGLSGQHPFRWRCLPELTKIVLRPGGEAG